MIRRLLRLTFRLGLLTGIGLALFKVLKGRRSASEFGSPSADWAPPPAPNLNLPKTPPEPELIEPVMFEEIKGRKAAMRAVPDPAPDPAPMSAPEAAPEAPPAVPAQPAVAKKAAPAKKAPARKAASPAAAGPVKKVVPKKAPARKAASRVEATPAADPPVAKKAAPTKKAAKKQP